MKTILALLILALNTVNLQPQTIRSWDTRTIHWQRLDPNGAKYAVLEGDRDHPGQTFTYAFWMPDGAWVQPHFHSADARVFVVSGTLLLGQGTALDKSAAKSIPAGSLVLVPAHAPHWEGAKGDTLILGVAQGVWKTTNLP